MREAAGLLHLGKALELAAVRRRANACLVAEREVLVRINGAAARRCRAGTGPAFTLTKGPRTFCCSDRRVNGLSFARRMDFICHFVFIFCTFSSELFVHCVEYLILSGSRGRNPPHPRPCMREASHANGTTKGSIMALQIRRFVVALWMSISTRDVCCFLGNRIFTE